MTEETKMETTYTTEDLRKSIIKTAMSEEFATSEFGFLRDFINNIPTGISIKDTLREGEDAYLEGKYGDDPEAHWQKTTPKHEAGSWKYSLLPKNYQVNKSILINSLKLDIDIKDKTKNELQQSINNAKKGATHHADLIKFIKTLDKAVAIYRQLNAEEQNAAKMRTEEFVEMIKTP